MKYKTGLAIMRMQPMHIGHESLINRMLAECENVIVLLGSAQESGTERNPFTVDQRTEMLRNVFGDRILVAGIPDLGNNNLWAGYALALVWQQFRTEVDAYYCGSEFDGPWFARAGLNLVNLDRTVIPISASEIRKNPAANLEYINKKNQKIVLDTLTKGK